MELHEKLSYRVFWSDEDESFVGVCLELPLISHLDDTFEATATGVRALAKDCIALLREDGKPVPEPLGSAKYSGKLMVRLPPDVHRRLAIEAADQRISLNRLITSKLAG